MSDSNGIRTQSGDDALYHGEGMKARRRNGRQPSCEPCRKLKLRCDHATPFCGRCTRREMTDKCVYHPAPMTMVRGVKARNSRSSTTRSPAKRGSSAMRSEDLQLGGVTPDDSNAEKFGGCLSTMPDALDVALPSAEDEASRGALFKRTHPSYYNTSFSATFTENESTFANVLVNLPEECEEAMSFLSSNTKEENSARMLRGIEVLRQMPSKSKCAQIVEAAKQSVREGLLPNLLVHASIKRFWDLYEEDLEPPRSSANVSRVVVDLCKNAKIIRTPSPTEGQSLLDWLLGPRITWEIVANVLAFIGAAHVSLTERHPLLDQVVNRKSVAWRMCKAAEDCLRFCDEADMLNENVIVAMANSSILYASCVGDENYQCSRRLGNMSNAAVTINLHRLPPDCDQPIHVWRRLIWAIIYFIDKMHASFNARPPGLTKQFCRHRDVPEISEEALFGTTSDFRAAMAATQSAGQDHESQITDMTWCRTLCTMTSVREDILALSLGLDVAVPLPTSHIDVLVSHLEAAHATWPTKLKYVPEVVNTLVDLDLFRIIRNHAEYLQNRFLLERLRVAKCRDAGQRLLNVSTELMKVVLTLWTKRDVILSFQAYFDWMVVCYGIPVAGVLCVQLLKTTRPPQAGEPRLVFSRSSAIQDLTMFLGFLDWIRPTDGNYRLCSKLKNVIRRIVDKVLDPPIEASGALQPDPAIAIQQTDAVDDGARHYAMHGMSGLYSNSGRGTLAGGVDTQSWNLAAGFMGLPPQLDFSQGESLDVWNPPLDGGGCLDWLGATDWTTQGNWMDFWQ